MIWCTRPLDATVLLKIHLERHLSICLYQTSGLRRVKPSARVTSLKHGVTDPWGQKRMCMSAAFGVVSIFLSPFATTQCFCADSHCVGRATLKPGSQRQSGRGSTAADRSPKPLWSLGWGGGCRRWKSPAFRILCFWWQLYHPPEACWSSPLLL